jgi:hypothetical protein
VKVISGYDIFGSEAWDDEHLIRNSAEYFKDLNACKSEVLSLLGLAFIQTSFENPKLFPVLEVFTSQIITALIERGEFPDTIFGRFEQLREMNA